MEEKHGAPDVPYFVYEEAVARMERTISRLTAVVILSGVTLILNTVVLYYRFFA